MSAFDRNIAAKPSLDPTGSTPCVSSPRALVRPMGLGFARWVGGDQHDAGRSIAQRDIGGGLLNRREVEKRH